MYTFTVYKYMGMLCANSLSISTRGCYVHLHCIKVNVAVMYTFTFYKYMGLLCTHSLTKGTWGRYVHLRCL